LKAHYGWRRQDEDSDDAWDDYQSALKEELTLWFGAEDDIVAWHALCRAIRIKPLPITSEDRYFGTKTALFSKLLVQLPPILSEVNGVHLGKSSVLLVITRWYRKLTAHLNFLLQSATTRKQTTTTT
jgi:hypothetical protein